ncbi:MAG: hypothetical protein LBC84_08320 [Prevotellaceae bacterium]|nr:hypothetical protein [Prevotellaceae bacterium]
MRVVRVSGAVIDKISNLEFFLKNDLKLSKEAAQKRCDRMRTFLFSLGKEADYALCRFQMWQILGYRCAVFEKSWVFAYEVFDDGIIVRDMSHTTVLAN